MISSSHRPLPDSTLNRQTSIPPGGIRNHNLSSKRSQTSALDRAATRTDLYLLQDQNNFLQFTANVTATFNPNDRGTFASHSSIIPCSRHAFYSFLITPLKYITLMSSLISSLLLRPVLPNVVEKPFCCPSYTPTKLLKSVQFY